MFWVTDNFLMHRSHVVQRTRRDSVEKSLLQRVKVRYRSIRTKDNNKRHDSESDVLLSADEELLDSQDVQRISENNAILT